MRTDLGCQLDVFKCGQVLYKIIKLEYESHIGAAEICQLTLVHTADLTVSKPYCAGCGRVHTAEYIEQCGFAGTARSDYHTKLTLIYCEAHIVQRTDFMLTAFVNFADVIKFNV